MMEQFLKGFAKEEKKKFDVKVDISQELADILNVYTESEKHLKQKEADLLNGLSGYMKRFVEVREERQKVTSKLNDLTAKLIKNECDECKEEEDDE